MGIARSTFSSTILRILIKVAGLVLLHPDPGQFSADGPFGADNRARDN
jgi:hypothetical protein